MLQYLVETMFKGGFKTLMSVLFVLFRSAKCVIETAGYLEVCNNSTLCASFITVYLLLSWGMNLMQGSIKSEYLRDKAITIENIAQMKISWRQIVQVIARKH